MADNHSKEIHNKNMSHIRSAESKPEIIGHKLLFSQSFRYRKNVHSLPGCPDIVLNRYHTIVFVNGCFWNKHDCPRFVWPSSNQEYWEHKILSNVERDKRDITSLQNMGWHVIIVWECELNKKCCGDTLNQLARNIRSATKMPQQH